MTPIKQLEAIDDALDAAGVNNAIDGILLSPLDRVQLLIEANQALMNDSPGKRAGRVILETPITIELRSGVVLYLEPEISGGLLVQAQVSSQKRFARFLQVQPVAANSIELRVK